MIPFKLLIELANRPHLVRELSYRGNIGIQELMSFYDKATDEQKDQLEHFLTDEDIEAALALLELVTGIRLERD